MANPLSALSVFVASPGGLEAERNKFFEATSRFNAEESLSCGAVFMPQGHELAYAAAGRPQELINDKIKTADYLVVVFWDKWGMPTSNQGPYTSGTEEEYYVGLECLRDENSPMKDIAVFFKAPSDRQLSDPGEQLQKVLEFRKKLEMERVVLYRTFANPEEFEREFERTLSKWSKDWKSGEPKREVPPSVSLLPEIHQQGGNNHLDGALFASLNSEDTASLIERAKDAAKQRRDTLAHQYFAQATTGIYNSEAWTEYVRFLRKTNRFGQLQIAAGKMLEKARDLDDYCGAAEAFSNLGIAKRSQGQRESAIHYFDSAIKEVDRWENAVGVTNKSADMRAFLLDNIGLTYRRMPGRLKDAAKVIAEAIVLHEQTGANRGRAHALRNMGLVQAQVGDLEQSRDSLQDALDIFNEIEDPRGIAMALSSLGETLELIGDYDAAISNFEKALARNQELGNIQGCSMIYGLLARTLIKMNRPFDAEENIQACFDINQDRDSPEGYASALNEKGRLSLFRDEYSSALDSFNEALNQFRSVDQPIGMISASLGLCRAYLGLGDNTRAAEALKSAEELLSETPNWGLREEAVKIRRSLK